MIASNRRARSPRNVPQPSAERVTAFIEGLEGRALLSVAFVTNGADSGAGSFRDAIARASTGGVDTIIFKGKVAEVALDSSVVYTGGQDLTIKGNGAAIIGDDTFDLFVSSSDANLSLEKLTFRDGARGVFVPISGDATGTVAVSLDKVTIEGNTSHGLHVDDQTIGSNADVSVIVRHSRIADNGSGEIDQDGIRIDEGGLGSISAIVEHTLITGSGGDGLELDERGEGNAVLNILHSDFVTNGYLVPADLDDGVDVDEADAGKIAVTAAHATFSNNFEEGLDLNEAGEGDLTVDLRHVEAIGNGEEGIDVEEFLEGNVAVEFDHVVANGNGREGADIKERDLGSLTAVLRHVTASGNAGDGVKADETGAGDLTISIIDLVAVGNVDRGINLDEAAAGILDATLIRIFSNNPIADDVA